MFTSGAVIALAIALWFSKLSWRARMRLLSHPLMLDICVFIVITALHWGTFSGVMAAAVGALMVSVMISGARNLWGYTEPKTGKYVRGMFDVSDKLIQGK